MVGGVSAVCSLNVANYRLSCQPIIYGVRDDEQGSSWQFELFSISICSFSKTKKSNTFNLQQLN